MRVFPWANHNAKFVEPVQDLDSRKIWFRAKPIAAVVYGLFVFVFYSVSIVFSNICRERGMISVELIIIQ